MRISDWSSDVCSSDLRIPEERWPIGRTKRIAHELVACPLADMRPCNVANVIKVEAQNRSKPGKTDGVLRSLQTCLEQPVIIDAARSEEHTSELQSLMRISYAVFCLKKKK